MITWNLPPHPAGRAMSECTRLQFRDERSIVQDTIWDNLRKYERREGLDLPSDGRTNVLCPGCGTAMTIKCLEANTGVQALRHARRVESVRSSATISTAFAESTRSLPRIPISIGCNPAIPHTIGD